MGRFISEDPLGFAGGSDSFYSYVGDNPIKFVDPLGLCPTCTQLQKEAAYIANNLEKMHQDAELLGFGSGLGAALAGAGEGVTFGIDTPVTVTFGSATGFFSVASILTGAAAATLDSWASGDSTALAKFDFTQG